MMRYEYFLHFLLCHYKLWVILLFGLKKGKPWTLMSQHLLKPLNFHHYIQPVLRSRGQATNIDGWLSVMFLGCSCVMKKPFLCPAEAFLISSVPPSLCSGSGQTRLQHRRQEAENGPHRFQTPHPQRGGHALVPAESECWSPPTVC